MRIAVIGTGISGNLAARLLATTHDVVVFEQGDYVGGHAQTLDVQVDGQAYALDTGFMVFNERTYPHFCRMLALLGVAAQDSDMSFSVRCGRTGLEYQGSSLSGLFSQRRNLLRPGFHRMLLDILRFNRRAIRAVEQDQWDERQTVGQFLAECRVGRAFIEQYFVPMTAAIWSARPARIYEFPARFMLGFCHNHGLLQIRQRPQWRTVRGGSRSYVTALTGAIRDRIHVRCGVQTVRRTADQVTLELADGRLERCDEVVLAVHADQALSMLADADPRERQILSAFPYQANTAVLHTDTGQLPRQGRAWASWNYFIPADPDGGVSVTYDLSRLQRCGTGRPVLLTLNPRERIEPVRIVDRLHYAHPAYGSASQAAQQRWGEISGRRRAHFCGAYWGYGFHEDGVNSALAVARHLLPPRQAGQADWAADLLGYLTEPVRPLPTVPAPPSPSTRSG